VYQCGYKFALRFAYVRQRCAGAVISSKKVQFAFFIDTDKALVIGSPMLHPSRKPQA
jgi:hypothetical protein